MPEAQENAKESVEKTDESKPEADLIPLEESWQIRDCDLYYDEYKECTSIRGRFHQYFIYGATLDCRQWRKDYDNCYKWRDQKDVKAGYAVINSEKERRLQRFRAHYRNNVWKKRESPPEDWDKPLPEWMAKRDENSYLAVKAKEMREGIDQETNKSFCTIM